MDILPLDAYPSGLISNKIRKYEPNDQANQSIADTRP
jgi:hypothetical protein